MREVYVFDRKGIEDFITNKENTNEYKRVFEKCGLFFKDTYVIYSDEYDVGSPLENLRKFLENEFGEYAFENFYATSHKMLPMEVYPEDLKKDEELLKEIENEKKILEEKLEKLKEKEEKITKKIIKKGER